MDSVTYGDPGTNFPKHHSGLVFVPQVHSRANIQYKLLCYVSYGYISIKTSVDKTHLKTAAHREASMATSGVRIPWGHKKD